MFYMSGLGWGEGQLEETAWGQWQSLREGQTDRRKQPADTQPWEQGSGEAGQSTNVPCG